MTLDPLHIWLSQTVAVCNAQPKDGKPKAQKFLVPTALAKRRKEIKDLVNAMDPPFLKIDLRADPKLGGLWLKLQWVDKP